MAPSSTMKMAGQLVMTRMNDDWGMAKVFASLSFRATGKLGGADDEADLHRVLSIFDSSLIHIMNYGTYPLSML